MDRVSKIINMVIISAAECLKEGKTREAVTNLWYSVNFTYQYFSI